jgi:hypothetical protein
MSVIGPIVINTVLSISTVLLMVNQHFFTCNIFDGNNADLRKWWELADNHVASVTTILTMYQILHAALAYNTGVKYRQGGLRNRSFIVIYVISFVFVSIILLLNPNFLGCMFRINCGTPEALSNLGYSIPFNAPSDYISILGHNVIPMYFRLTIFGMSTLNLFLVWLWERVVILGLGRELLIGFNGNGKLFIL